LITCKNETGGSDWFESYTENHLGTLSTKGNQNGDGFELTIDNFDGPTGPGGWQ